MPFVLPYTLTLNLNLLIASRKIRDFHVYSESCWTITVTMDPSVLWSWRTMDWTVKDYSENFTSSYCSAVCFRTHDVPMVCDWIVLPVTAITEGQGYRLLLTCDRIDLPVTTTEVAYFLTYMYIFHSFDFLVQSIWHIFAFSYYVFFYFLCIFDMFVCVTCFVIHVHVLWDGTLSLHIF